MTAGDLTPSQRRLVTVAGISALRSATRAPRRRATCKCLFGRPEREDTRRLLAEQYARDRQRMIKRYNFDLDTGKAFKTARLEEGVADESNKENRMELAFAVEDKENTPGKEKVVGAQGRCAMGSPSCRRLPRTPSKRSPLSSRRQLQMTDYWTHRRRSESAGDKEN